MTRKITHNLTRPSDPSDEIEEDIQVEFPVENTGWITIINSENSTKKEFFKPPKFFDSHMNVLMQVRHFTPPFVNIVEDYKSGSNVQYDPLHKCYESV